MSRVSYIIVTAFVICISAPLSALAQDEETFTAAYVNMLQVANEYEGFNEAIAEAENKIIEAQTADEAKLAEYQAKITELTEKLQGPLTDEAKAATEAEIEQVYWEAMAYREQAFANYEMIQQETLEPVYKDIYEKVAEIAGEENYDVVFDYELLLFVSEDFTDITEQVVTELNEELGFSGQ
ncbi:MAG: OmpH family outer membrane protein [Candidatus Coatesbacteria bacterium]|nr:MAG: OmpH family outer membrane protein [Candidatus Coatesbacteria bacterium]